MKISPFKIEEWMNKYECHAKYDFTTTCIKSFSLKELLGLCGHDAAEFYEKSLDYGDITGSKRLKSACLSLYKGFDFENITVTHGAIGANELVFKSLVEPKDEVVVVIPIYQQLYSVPEQIGANVKFVRLKEDLDWHVDFEEFENAVTDKTKLVVLNNPNNPTGAVFSKSELVKIVEIAKKHGSYILCDEVYRFLEHEKNNDFVSITELYEKGISTFSMSKTFSLAGVRVGFVVAADKKIIAEINHQRQYNTISISFLDDYTAALALENKKKIIARNLEIIENRKNILLNKICQIPQLSFVTPQAGTTAFVKYHSEMNSYEFCLKLFNETGVLLLPGEALEFDKYFRLGYCIDERVLSDGIDVFANWLKINC
ncbi:MAG: aminotransferase class I/II-fold pyridoxal phosphate-dependent enzyme [Candidatus Gastranaerophilaceae bacterium]